jgi:hypothetical protein
VISPNQVLFRLVLGPSVPKFRWRQLTQRHHTIIKASTTFPTHLPIGFAASAPPELPPTMFCIGDSFKPFCSKLFSLLSSQYLVLHTLTVFHFAINLFSLYLRRSFKCLTAILQIGISFSGTLGITHSRAPPFVRPPPTNLG